MKVAGKHNNEVEGKKFSIQVLRKHNDDAINGQLSQLQHLNTTLNQLPNFS